MKGSYDGAEPAGNSVTVQNLLRLAQLQSKPEWRHLTPRLMESFSEIINHYPPYLPLRPFCLYCETHKDSMGQGELYSFF
jgi:uncharacterized protein YyaL (SSP411 family)